MTLERLEIPGSTAYLVDGSIVKLASFGATAWIVHYGWFTYNGDKTFGWYVSSIPAQTIMPLTNEDLVGVNIISPGYSCGCGSNIPPRPPPFPVPSLSVTDVYQIKHSMLTVATMAERDELAKYEVLPHGKVVRVLDCPDGKPRFFAWDQINRTWVEENFGFVWEDI